jgi:guanosine-3',5'-bis(diphosphate) 3'-pyrophosphohydrolase
MKNDKDDFSLIMEALTFAASKHRTQRRKDGRDTPYINHPIEVARILATVGGVNQAPVLVAAILHDTIEDTDATPDEIKELFGAEILSVVMECTDDKSLPKAERKKKQVELAPHKSNEAKHVKIADKISNVRDIGENPPADWSHERMQEYLDWTEKVVAGLRGSNQELDKLYDKTLERARAAVHERVSRASRQVVD